MFTGKSFINAALFMLLTISFVSAQSPQDTDHKSDKNLKSNARVNPSTLAMEFSLPFASFPGRGGNGVPVTLSYSSKVWTMKNHDFLNSVHTTPIMSGNGSQQNPYQIYHITSILPSYAERTLAGWSAPGLQAVREEWDDQWFEFKESGTNFLVYVKRVRIVLPDGSSHEFRKDDKAYFCVGLQTNDDCTDVSLNGTYLAVDGSGMRFEQSSGGNILYMPDGGRYYTSATPQVYIDRNGNKTTFDTTTKVLTDTLGREISNPFGASATVGSEAYYLDGIGSTTRTFTKTWQVLKPSGCVNGYESACSDAALEDPADELYYLGNDTCASENYDNPVGTPRLFGVMDPEHNVRSEGGGMNPTVYYRDSQTQRMCSANAVFNPVVLTKVTMPDGSEYKFRYNRHGEITKIIYPTGAYERFAYQELATVTSYPFSQTNRGVSDRWVSEDGTNETQHWQYSTPQAGTVTTLENDGTKTVSMTHQSGGYPHGFENPKTGMPYDVKFYSAPSTPGNESTRTLMRRELTEWTNTAPRSGGTANWGERDARATKKISIIFESGESNALATMSETVYDDNGNSDASYFSSLNPITTKTYDYLPVSASTASSASLATAVSWFSGATAAVVNKNVYLYDSNYKARNLNGLVSETRVEDVSNNVKAKTQIFYDTDGGQSLLNESESSRWEDPSTTYRGLVTKTRSWYDISNNLYIDTQAQYDMMGNLRKSWDGNSNLSQIEYSSTYDYAYPTKTISPIPDTNGTYGLNDELETTTTYDFNTGLRLTVTDPNGAVTKMEYDDPLLRPTKVTTGYGTALAAETITEYGAGTSASTRWVKVKSQIDATNWKEGLQWFDGLGRTIRTQSVDTESGDVFALSCYDEFGRPSKSSNPFRGYSSSTHNCSTSNGSNDIHWTTNTFDTAGRPWKVTTPDGAEVETTYGLAATSGYLLGSVVTVEDQAGKLRRSVTNALGQLKRVDEPNSSNVLGSLTSPNQPTVYSYNTTGQMVQVEQGSQNRYFMYDSLGRLLRLRQPEQEVNTDLNTSGNPNNNSWTVGFTYDNNGNVLTTNDAKDTTITSTFDRLNRQVSRTYSDGTPTVTNYYDGTGLSSVPNYSKSKLTKVTSSVSETQYSGFDVLGRLTESKQITPLDGETLSTAPVRTSSYQYNLSGALIQQTYPSGRVVETDVDASGDIANVTSKKNSSAIFGTFANNFSYTAAGAISSLRLGNSKWENTKYNTRLQPIEMGLGASSTDAGAWKVAYEYGELQTNGTVDATKNSGNIGKQTLTVPGTSFVTAYKYDPLNRLTEAQEKTGSTQNWIQQFGYDVYGNRTSFNQTIGSTTTTTTPSVNASTNRFNTGQGFSYDANGNIVQDADPVNSHTRAFTFNGDNKQTEVKDVTNSNHVLGKYYYDGEGKRVKKVTDTETTVFVYSLGKLVAEYSTQISSSPTVSYTTSDHLGSPRVVTDTVGQVKARRDFMPFGEELYAGVGGRSGNGGMQYSSDIDDIRRKFTVYQRDDETDLDFAQLRMYSSSQGRFLGVDPVTADIYAPNTLNRYQYCMNNPLRFIDSGGGYDEEVHRDLTAALAYVAGFSREQGDIIGAADQWLDDPKSGHTPMPWSNGVSDLSGYIGRRDYHFTTQGRRNDLFSVFEAEVSGGDQPLSALGTYLHARQDKYSHEGFGPKLGQVAAIGDGLSIKDLRSIQRRMEEMEKYDKTTFDPGKAEKMARDTLGKLLLARNLMANSGRFGTFRAPVPYSAIEAKIKEWARTDGRDEKKKILMQIIYIVDNYKPAQDGAGKKKRPRRKTSVRMLDD